MLRFKRSDLLEGHGLLNSRYNDTNQHDASHYSEGDFPYVGQWRAVQSYILCPTKCLVLKTQGFARHWDGLPAGQEGRLVVRGHRRPRLYRSVILSRGL